MTRADAAPDIDSLHERMREVSRQWATCNLCGNRYVLFRGWEHDYGWAMYATTKAEYAFIFWLSEGDWPICDEVAQMVETELIRLLELDRPKRHLSDANRAVLFHLVLESTLDPSPSGRTYKSDLIPPCPNCGLGKFVTVQPVREPLTTATVAVELARHSRWLALSEQEKRNRIFGILKKEIKRYR